MVATDDWDSFVSAFGEDNHEGGKEHTVGIEGNNCRLRHRMNRSISVEGAFGVEKEDYHFRQFMTRGKGGVRRELLLLCFGYNVNKLHHKI
jgi:hypothetical protein